MENNIVHNRRSDQDMHNCLIARLPRGSHEIQQYRVSNMRIQIQTIISPRLVYLSRQAKDGIVREQAMMITLNFAFYIPERHSISLCHTFLKWGWDFKKLSEKSIISHSWSTRNPITPVLPNKTHMPRAQVIHPVTHHFLLTLDKFSFFFLLSLTPTPFQDVFDRWENFSPFLTKKFAYLFIFLHPFLISPPPLLHS